MKKLLISMLVALWALCALSVARASGDGVALDRFPTQRVTDLSALQNGAKLFVNYCLNCHSASYMRYNRMQDIGLTEDQIAQQRALTPLGRTGTPEDAANAIYLFCQPESDFITGETVRVDGGRHVR